MKNPISLFNSGLTESEQLQSVVQSKHQDIPGSIIYSYTRYHTIHPINLDESVVMIYHHEKVNSPNNFLELRFCLSTNSYCTHANCHKCDKLSSESCFNQQHIVDVYIFRFNATFLAQFTQNVKLQDHKDQVLALKYPISFNRTFLLCSR